MKMRPLRHAAWFANRCSEWLVLLVLLAASIPPMLVQHRSLTAVPELNLLDGSWLLDLSYKASGGIWLGRDVAFTYGPLFQWLSSAPARWIGISTGTIFATWYTLPLLLVVVATFLTVRLLLPEAAGWQRALLLLLAVVFWSPADVRVSVCLLAFAMFVRVTDSVASGSSILWRSLAAAAVCSAAFWLSTDTGLYCTAGLLLCAAASALVLRRIAPMKPFLLITAGWAGVFVVLTNAAMFSLFDFRFWRSGFAVVAGYRWFEPFSISKADKHLVLQTLGLGIAVFAAAWRWRRAGVSYCHRPVFLLSGFCLALLILQTALIRSDHGHVVLGIYPMIFFCGLIAMSELQAPLLSGVAAVVVVIATLVLASPYPRYTPRNVLMHWRQTVDPVLNCSTETKEFDRNCFPPGTAALLSEVSDYVNSQTAPGNSIAIFPYETAFGLFSRRQVAEGVLQSYLVSGAYLTELELAGLGRSNPPFALYFPDGQFSIALDEVPNFTRSPEVWFYLLRHYHLVGTPFPGVVGLARDVNRAGRLSFAEFTIAEAAAAIAIHKRKASVSIALRDWPATGADFLKLRLKVSYPFWWQLGKPSKLALQLVFADGSNRTIVFLVEPNHSNDIWVFPWQPEAMATYFLDDQAQWHPAIRPALVSLNLVVQPYDWISTRPNKILVEKVEAVTLDLK